MQKLIKKVLDRELKVLTFEDLSVTQNSKEKMDRMILLNDLLIKNGYMLSLYSISNIIKSSSFTDIYNALLDFIYPKIPRNVYLKYHNFDNTEYDSIMMGRIREVVAIITNHHDTNESLDTIEGEIYGKPKDIQVISTISINEFVNTTIKNILLSSANVSEPDVEMFKMIKKISTNKTFKELSKIKIPNKNNRVVAAFELGVKNQIESIDDICRYVYYVYNGTTEIEKKDRYGIYSMKNSIRKFILENFEIILKRNKGVDYTVDTEFNTIIGCKTASDTKKYRNFIQIMFGFCHPNKYNKKYIYTQEYAQIVRNGKIVSVNSHLEDMKSRGEFFRAACLLIRSGDSGMFLASFDQLYSHSKDNGKATLIKFLQNFVVERKTSMRSMVKLYNFYASYEESLEKRIVYPKGSALKAKEIKGISPENQISLDERELIMNILLSGIRNKFSLICNKKIYIEKEFLDTVKYPVTTISKSSMDKPIARGTRIKIPTENNKLRFFLHWFNNKCKWDNDIENKIDLSVSYMDDGMNYLRSTNYEDCIIILQSDKGTKLASHSGDIRTAPVSEGGGTEFLDIRLDLFNKYYRQARYLIPTCVGFDLDTGLKEYNTTMGVMSLNDMTTRKYDKNFVIDELDISVSSSQYCPFIFDMETNEMVYIDIDNGDCRSHCSVSDKDFFEGTIGSCILRGIRPVLYLEDFVTNNLVDSKEKADIVISKYPKDNTSYNIYTVGDFIKQYL